MKPTILIALVLSAVSAFADTATIKLRKFELRTVQVTINEKQVPLSYGDVLKQVLLSPSPGGSTTDQLIKISETWEPIKKDIDAKKSEIYLDQPSYDTVLQKLNSMQWSPAQELVLPISDFIKYVRDLKEQEYNATPK